MQSLQELIQQMQQQSPYKHKLTAAALAGAWQAIMPAAVQQRTLRTFYKADKFFVQLSSAPLRQSLQLQKSQVSARLQAHLQASEPIEVVFW
ncbi:MAG: DciA family protein [Bacteroidota bacterium]